MIQIPNGAIWARRADHRPTRSRSTSVPPRARPATSHSETAVRTFARAQYQARREKRRADTARCLVLRADPGVHAGPRYALPVLHGVPSNNGHLATLELVWDNLPCRAVGAGRGRHALDRRPWRSRGVHPCRQSFPCFAQARLGREPLAASPPQPRPLPKAQDGDMRRGRLRLSAMAPAAAGSGPKSISTTVEGGNGTATVSVQLKGTKQGDTGRGPAVEIR
jgi:hypothetical protein